MIGQKFRRIGDLDFLLKLARLASVEARVATFESATFPVNPTQKSSLPYRQYVLCSDQAAATLLLYVMPRIISYTPAWLSRPSPGFQLFNTVSQKQGSRSRTVDTSDTQGEYVGPNRIIARRNTEIFVVVGKQIRWADLPSLKDQWHAMQETPSKKTKGKLIEAAETHGEEDTVPEDGSYRVYR